MSEAIDPLSLQPTLLRLAELMRADPELGLWAAHKRVSITFRIPDAALAYNIRLQEGAVDAGLGAPDEADLEITMRSRVFDGIFMGRLNAANAFGAGQIAVTGDFAEAMRLQSLMPRLQHLYAQARQG